MRLASCTKSATELKGADFGISRCTLNPSAIPLVEFDLQWVVAQGDNTLGISFCTVDKLAKMISQDSSSEHTFSR